MSEHKAKLAGENVSHDECDSKSRMIVARFCLKDASKAAHRKRIDDCVKSGVCVPPPFGCGGIANQFSDSLSKKEYRIGGMCQTCQDFVFGGYITHATQLQACYCNRMWKFLRTLILPQMNAICIVPTNRYSPIQVITISTCLLP